MSEPIKGPPPAHPSSRSRMGSLKVSLTKCMDGLWALINTYPTRGTADTTVYRLRRSDLPEGKWEFVVRPIDGRYGIWVRNLDGPLVDTD